MRHETRTRNGEHPSPRGFWFRRAAGGRRIHLGHDLGKMRQCLRRCQRRRLSAMPVTMSAALPYGSRGGAVRQCLRRCQRRRLSAMPATTSAALPYGKACDALCNVCSNVFTDHTHTAVIIEDVQFAFRHSEVCSRFSIQCAFGDILSCSSKKH